LKSTTKVPKPSDIAPNYDDVVRLWRSAAETSDLNNELSTTTIPQLPSKISRCTHKRINVSKHGSRTRAKPKYRHNWYVRTAAHLDTVSDTATQGGGIIGSTTAYFLSHHPSFDKERDSITLLEATKIAGGASGKAGGLLALWAYPSCIVPLSYRLHKEVRTYICILVS